LFQKRRCGAWKTKRTGSRIAGEGEWPPTRVEGHERWAGGAWHLSGPRIGGAFAGMKRGAYFCFARLEIGKRDEGLWVVGGVGWLHTARQDEGRQGSDRDLRERGCIGRGRHLGRETEPCVGAITTVNSPLHLK
jgi:hypothetical protein